jgi:hypothetical protein
MNKECFNCVGPASDRYTVIVEGSVVAEEAVVCEACVLQFRDEDGIEVHDAPARMKGEDPDQDESE